MKLKLSLLVFTALLSSYSYAAGFDCSKAKSTTEKTICSTASLSDLDEILVLSFKKALAGSSDAQALKGAQQAWLKTRESCASNIDCITKTYTTRINELVGLVAKNQKKITATSTSTPIQNVPTQTTTNTKTEPAPAPTPTPSSKMLTGKITSYDCGDNCYLTVRDDQGEDHVALCTADLCSQWNEVAAMPANYLNKKVKVSVGRGKQYDGAGTEMGEMDAFDSITLLE